MFSQGATPYADLSPVQVRVKRNTNERMNNNNNAPGCFRGGARSRAIAEAVGALSRRAVRLHATLLVRSFVRQCLLLFKNKIDSFFVSFLLIDRRRHFHKMHSSTKSLTTSASRCSTPNKRHNDDKITGLRMPVRGQR